ncbi:MAG: TolC family protein [Actinobacteria bacterium]|nr:TolC family protein [Actinomycetota bacterium]
MSIERFTWLFALGILLSVGTAFSAPLTLKDCLQRAQQNSYRLKADEQRAGAAQKNYQFERSQTLPQISAELSGEQRYLQPYNFHQQWTLLHGDWALGNFLLKTAKTAEQDALMIKAEKEQTRLDVSRRAALLYMSILQKQTQANLLQERLELLRTHHEVALALWQAGTRTQFDLLQTEAEMSQLQEQMAKLDMKRETLWQELSRIIAWDTSEHPQFPPVDAATISNQPVPKLRGGILASNPLMQALSFRIRAQEIRTRSIKAQQLPHLHVAGGYFADGDPTGDGNYWQMNAGFDLPLFRWGATKFQRQESQALMQSLQFQKKQVERRLTIYIQQTIKKLARLKNVLELQKGRLQITKKAFQFAEANYQAGLITNLDYLSAQQQLTETRIAIQETQLEYVMNLIEFYVMTNQVEKIEKL